MTPFRVRRNNPLELIRDLDYQQLLVEHLGLVDKVVRFVARRHHLSDIDADEFAGLVRVKLVDHDFVILRKFEHRSSLNTYLTIVIERLCLDFCTAKWGKWRPSAAARRLGGVAILLEQLIVRDGVTFDEAVATLQTNHGVSETRGDLHALVMQLPVRTPRRNAGALSEALSPPSADAHFDRGDDERLVDRVHDALAEAFGLLDPRDQRILELRFGHSRSVGDIARALGTDAKPLYRRLKTIIGALRSELKRRGIDEAAIARVVGHPRLALSGVLVGTTRR